MSLILDDDLDDLCRDGRIQMSRHYDVGIFK